MSLKYALSVDHVDIFLNQLVKFYLNNMVNLHPLTPRIMPSYTHKKAKVTIDSVTSFHPMYSHSFTISANSVKIGLVDVDIICLT